MVKQYKHDNIAWMEFKFSDSCYQEAKKRLIDQEEMFDLFNPYTSKQYTVQYFYYDNLNVLIFNQKIESSAVRHDSLLSLKIREFFTNFHENFLVIGNLIPYFTKSLIIYK